MFGRPAIGLLGLVVVGFGSAGIMWFDHIRTRLGWVLTGRIAATAMSGSADIGIKTGGSDFKNNEDAKARSKQVPRKPSSTLK